jgi:hypothetical protein
MTVYQEFDFEMPLDQFVTQMQAVLASIPVERRKTATIKLDSGDYRDGELFSGSLSVSFEGD